MTPSPSFIYTSLAWIRMGRPHASFMNHSAPTFALVTSSFLNLNLTTAKEANHRSKMATLVEQLWHAGSARVLLFITTHSEENQGDLFLGLCNHEWRDGPVADEVTNAC